MIIKTFIQCDEGQLIYNECEGLYICNKCFSYAKFFIENDKVSSFACKPS